MINLHNLDKHHAVLTEFKTPEYEKKDGKETGRVNLVFSLAFYSEDYGKREREISRFIQAIREEELVFRGVTYEGELAVKERATISPGVEEITCEGSAFRVLTRETLEITGERTILNRGNWEVPCTVIATKACEVSGLTEKPIKVTGAVTITDDGRLLRPDGSNGSALVEFWQFPYLKAGMNTVRTTAPITLTYRGRL